MRKSLKAIAMCLAALMIVSNITTITAQAAPNYSRIIKEKVKISEKKKTVKVGDTFTLKVTGTKKTPKWKSSDTDVVYISKKGKAVAKKVGKVKITATIGSKKYKCTVTVEKLKATKDAPFKTSVIKLGNYKAAVPKNMEVVYTGDMEGDILAEAISNTYLIYDEGKTGVVTFSYMESPDDVGDDLYEYMESELKKEYEDVEVKTSWIYTNNGKAQKLQLSGELEGVPFDFSMVSIVLGKDIYAAVFSTMDSRDTDVEGLNEVAEWCIKSLTKDK